MKTSLLVTVLLLSSPAIHAEWEPPGAVSRDRILGDSRAVLAMPDIELSVREEIFRIRAMELDWDLGGMIYQPKDASRIPVGPDGRRLGAFLLHGGSSDHRFMDDVARLMASKFGFKVLTMTFPGRLYLKDPSRNWPGDTMNADGSVRAPMWNKDVTITSEEYVVKEDTSVREKYGTLILSCAKEGSEFYNRMAAWPVAFEEGARDMMRRHLPASDYSIYVHGRSTGGPFSFMLSQRVDNIAGVIGMENSPFGYIFRKQSRESGSDEGLTFGDVVPFNCLQVRTWRDIARMKGPEAADREGVKALYKLPILIEEVMQEWKATTKYAGFKAEGMVHFGSVEPLTQAAKAAAKRLKMTPAQTDRLIQQYIGYSRELAGPGVKPVPPVILGVAKYSADHRPEVYRKVTLPMFAAMKPAPRVRLVEFDSGTHFYAAPEPDLPSGVAPSVIKVWFDAIMNGYYLQNGNSGTQQPQ
jgi:hypothetical protein